jgi:hypothetical protein
MEEHRAKMFENKELRRILGPEGDKLKQEAREKCITSGFMLYQCFPNFLAPRPNF